MGRRIDPLVVVAALTAFVWAWPCRAQESLHSMGAGPMPLPLETPEGRDGDRAGPPATGDGEHADDAARARANALAAMERLRGEIQTLAAIRDAQAALLAWNRERARTGVPPAALSAAPCRDPALKPWCLSLPATFGEDMSGENSGGNGR